MSSSHALLEPVLSRRGLAPELSEFSLLLPTWQIERLSEMAEQQGLNVGQFLRGIIQQVATPRAGVHGN
jgi:hypothetical protein